MKKWSIFVLAFLLVSAFVMHAVSFDHHHPWDIVGGDRAQAALHGDNKKWLLEAASMLGFFRGLLVLNFSLYAFALKRFLLVYLRLFDPFRIALADGIMHPKLCA